MDADQTEIIGRVAMFLIGNSMFYIPLTFVNVVRFTIQGMGFSTFAILAGSAVDGHNTALPIATHLVIYAPAIARWPLASVVEHIIHIIISIQTVEITVDHFAELDFHQMYWMFRRRIGVFGPCEVSYRDVVIPDEAVF